MAVALTLSLALSACSHFNDEAVAIAPPSMQPAPTVPGAAAVSLSITAVDKRAQLRDRIADRAGIGAAKVTASNDVIETVRQAIEQEFQAEGFTLGGGLVVTVEVENFYGQYGGGTPARVVFTLRVRDRAGATLATEHYEGSARMRLTLITEEAEAIRKALEQALGNAVSALRNDAALKAKLLSRGTRT
jgi:uncharacterized lipoprotein YajG